MTRLLEELEEARARRKLLIPYAMAGVPDPAAFAVALTRFAQFSDAIEVGIPFSDPLMDGPVIATAARDALARGVGPRVALDLAGAVDIPPPKVVMTYYNPIHRIGEARFCGELADHGFLGLVVPDLPVEESSSLRAHAARCGLGWVPLVAPTTPPARVVRLVNAATGFVYAVSTLGVTGTRQDLSARAESVVAACRAGTDVPVVVGIGISSPAHARSVARFADGVVVGSALVTRLVERGVDDATRFLAEMRAGLDDQPV